MKKYAPPPERDPAPAMFVGDQAPPPAPVLPAKWEQAAATQPDEVSVVTKGEKMGRWVVLSPALFLAGLGLIGISPSISRAIMGGAALYGLCGWALHWHAGKQLRLFRMTNEGITLTVRHRWGGRPRVTRIVWAEMRKYTESVEAERAFLRVVDDFGDTITLQDHPARAEEFIRRFVEQAERHGVPSEPLPPPPELENEDEDEDDPAAAKGLGCLLWFVGVGTIAGVGDALGVSSDLTTLASFGLPSLALYLWNKLHDADVALRDRTSRNLMARLRRWLRKVLDVDVI